MAMQQIVLLASGTESIISSWDLHTGTQLSSFKNNATPRNCMCRAGDDYLVAAQANKDALQFWTWHKDQVLQRSFAMERMTSVAAAPGGVLLAAGGASGAIYIWELPSGRLLRTWSAHYKGVSCLSFTSQGDVLVSGSEDTLVSAWLVADLVDCHQDTSSTEHMRPQPLHSWSHHTLPVTGLYVTSGGCQASSLVVSCSLDRSVKVHSLAGQGVLLAVAQLPCAAMCVALDAGEHVMYAGGADGAVYEFSLVGEVLEVDGVAGATGRGAVDGAVDVSLGGGAHAVLRPHACMAGHSGGVNALAVSVDGELLVSGSEDGTAQVWHLRSRQATHVLQAPSKLPVTCVLVSARPPHLTAGGGGGTASGARTGPKRLAPLAPLVKYVGMSGTLKPWESAAVVLDGSNMASGLDGEVPGLTLFPPAGTEMVWLAGEDGWQGAAGAGEVVQGPGRMGQGFLESAGADVVGVTAVGGKGGEGEVVALRAALAAAQQEAQSWRALHGQLHAHCVQQVLLRHE